MMMLPLLVVVVTAGAAWAQDNPEGAFQHKKHAALKLKCNYCHTTAAKQERAGFPAAATQCKTCHTAIAADRKIPSTRVYRLADFVFFSHEKHVTTAAAKLDCATCHGDVYQQEVLKVERPVTMIACIACHKEHKANNACNACHELGQ